MHAEGEYKAREKARFWKLDFAADGKVQKSRTNAGKPVVIYCYGTGFIPTYRAITPHQAMSNSGHLIITQAG